MKPRVPRKSRSRGFALVVTLSLMILLTVIAVGLLTLSSITLRSSAVGEADARAFMNARLAVMLAIGELQKEAGDDRRITADASILTTTGQAHLVGTWSSWSPNFGAKPDQAAPDYVVPKTALFRTWLASSPDPAALKTRSWADTAADPRWPRLFSLTRDGFDLSAATVPTPRGSLAWAVSQENTKAKVNVAGPDTDAAVNVALQSQRRPSLALSAILKQPKGGWNLRAGRLLSGNQIQLDSDLVADAASTAAVGASFTVHAQGLLTDVLKGGLKTDLNLGFELSDSDFSQTSWGGTKNPFRSPNATSDFTSPTSYNGQRALFMPLVDNPIIANTTDYDPVVLADRFYAAAVPTFDHLRSFYQIPSHLYGSNPPTVAERGADHLAAKILPASGGAYFAPTNPPPGLGSSLSIRPVLNRMIYFLSATLDSQNKAQVLLTPIISLWNPYNTALDIEGAVAYPWMDLPFQIEWEFQFADKTFRKATVNMSEAMGKQFEFNNPPHGRSVNPFFLCEMTANGDGNLTTPIHFEPGELRLFVPAAVTPVKFIRKGNNAQRTVRLRPVDNVGQMNKKGGLLIPMDDIVANHGFSYTVKNTDKIRLTLKESLTGTYNYFVSLEDAARIKNPADSTRGQAITEVQTFKLASAVTEIISPQWSYSLLKTSPQPVGVIETFHRTAGGSIGGQPFADLIYTTNPRHASINHQLAAGTFKEAPHFQSTLRPATSFDVAIETSFDGRRTFWGNSHRAVTGQDHLPFFEVPREPLLSLAAFQHADLSSSTFAAANQVGNSWASPYLAPARAGEIVNKSNVLGPTSVPIYDTPYLANEALWDGFFFSGAAPVLEPANFGNPASAWKTPITKVKLSLSQVVKDFVADPLGKPLANSRMRLNKAGLTDNELVTQLLEPAGCARIAAHLTVDGGFNINSTDVEAWTAQLAATRGESFQVLGGSAPSSNVTAFPRFRHPTGTVDDNWNGFRALNDSQVRALAANIVVEVKKRGPFLSLAEFVNRRVENSDLGKSGAIQAAIITGKLNDSSNQQSFSADKYPIAAQPNIIKDTGVGIPGYLTQADILQALAPVITCRSDTFTIRGYGEAKDASGKVTARSWCEAVVQRTPAFVEATNAPETAIASLTATNKIFGRRFEIISFRRVPSTEIQ